MHESLGEIVASALEAIAGGGAPGGPRWLRIGCTAILLVLVIGLLTIGLWWPR